MNKRNKYLILLYLLFSSTFSTILFSQIPSNLDSLKSIYKKNPNDLESISLVMQAYAQSQPDSARHYATFLLKKTSPVEYDYKGRAYNVLGHYYLMKNNIDSAFYNYSKAIEIVKQGNLKFIEGVYTSNLAQAYFNKGEIKKSITYYKQAELLLLRNPFKNKTDYYLSTVYSGQGESYNVLCLYDKALEFLYKSFEISKKLNDKVNIGITLNTIGNIYQSMEDWEKSEKYNRLSLEYLKDVNYPLARGMIYYNLSEIEFKQKNYIKSEELLDSAYLIIKSNALNYSLGDVYNLYGLINLEKKIYDVSENFFQKGMNINTESNMPISKINSLKGLGDLYKVKNKEILALQYYEQALDILKQVNLPKQKKQILERIVELDTVLSNKNLVKYYMYILKNSSKDYLNEEKQKAIISQEVLYETDLKEALIKNQEMKLDREKLEKNRLYYIIGLISLVGGLLIFGIVNQQKKKSLLSKNTILDMQQELNKKELQNLNQQLNPHEFKNILTGIAPEIQDKAPKAYSYLIKLINLTNNSISNNSLTESLANQLEQINAYLTLEKNVLLKPLLWEVENLTINSNIQIPRLLLKNIVENSIKHGIKKTERDGHIYIKIGQDKQFLYINITDNGLGRKNTTRESGIALKTYQKLFQTLNQKNTLNAQILIKDLFVGTAVDIIIPLNYRY